MDILNFETMANKRIFKKKINEICNILYTQCLTIRLINKVNPITEIEGIIKGILFLQDKTLTACNKAPRKKGKAYFSKVLKEFKEKATELSDQLYAL